MKVGLYFGSFNPIHQGHLIIAKNVLNSGMVDELWFVVSPQNPFKNSSTLLNANHRFNLVKIAIEGELRIKASDIEFKLPKPSYTINTLTYLKEKYPAKYFVIIMGSDGFSNIDKWKNASVIISNYPIIIYERPGFKVEQKNGADTTIINAPLLEISSTLIRKLIKEKKSIRYLLPDAVKEEIERNNYYKSSLENSA